MKGAIVQVGADIEEAARVSGAGWAKAYFTVLMPAIMPTLALIGLFNFNAAANTTSSIILLASRETVTVSIVILHWLLPGGNLREEAAVLQLILGTVTLSTALLARHYAIKHGVRHR